MQIRTMELDDLDTIVLLEKELFVSNWSKEDFIYELKINPYAYYFVLEEDEIIGYCGLWKVDRTITITTLGIRKSQQGKGYSHILMDQVIDYSRGLDYLTLEVRPSNFKAIALYKKYGLEIKAIRKDYYEDHEDAYLMVKEV